MYVFYVIKYGYHDEIFAIFDVKIVLRGFNYMSIFYFSYKI